MGPKPKPVAERFWAKVRKGDGCWEWTAAMRADDNYGAIWRDGRQAAAHRVSWEMANGPVPAGMSVLHRCDNRKCVRPDHLFIGTQRDNVADKVAKDRQAKGGRNGGAKLTEHQVYEILDLCADGCSKKWVAKRFGISVSTIYYILNGKLWGYLRTEPGV